MAVFATALDYENYTERAAPIDVDRLLLRASEAIEDLIVIWFDDEDVDVAAALRDATCALVESWVATYGDEADTAEILPAGKISLGEFSSEGASSGLGALPARARRALNREGLLYRGAGVS